MSTSSPSLLGRVQPHEFRADILEAQLLNAISGDSVSVYTIDKIRECVGKHVAGEGFFLLQKTEEQQVLHDSLEVLLYTPMSKIPKSVLHRLPAVIMQYVGLNRKLGRKLMGPAAWMRVKAAYEKYATEHAPHAPNEEVSSPLQNSEAESTANGWWRRLVSVFFIQQR
ncbi:Uncharacterised protein [Achromobacter sp. 2789STDY5608633]|jgi:hypothetical protein|nr:Uncharacterised protein [Achromobacter sp. 2789STDY5608633]